MGHTPYDVGAAPRAQPVHDQASDGFAQVRARQNARPRPTDAEFDPARLALDYGKPESPSCQPRQQLAPGGRGARAIVGK